MYPGITSDRMTADQGGASRRNLLPETHKGKTIKSQAVISEIGPNRWHELVNHSSFSFWNSKVYEALLFLRQSGLEEIIQKKIF